VAKVIKYGNVSAIETDFKAAPVGLYYAKVDSVEQKQSKNDEAMVEVVFRLTKDANGKKLKENYGQLWYYAPLDPNSSWARRMKELVVAFGLKPKGGNLGVIEGKEAMLRLREDTDLNGDYRPNIGRVMKVQEPEVDEDDEEEEEDSSNGELDGLSRAELKAIIKEEGLEVSVKKSMSDDDLREAIEEQRAEEDDDEEDDEDDEPEEDDEEDDDEPEAEEEDNYDSMSVSALRQELTDRELETKGKRTVLIARLRTDDVEEPV
jgi:hypothetical protein